MPDALPNVGDIHSAPEQEPSVQSPSAGRVLQMRPAESTPETLDERISEVIHEVQNGGSAWQHFEGQISDRWRGISSEAKAVFEELSIHVRRLSRERPLYLIGVVTLTFFFVGAVLRATRSRYE